MTYPRRYPVRYTEPEVVAKVLTVLADSEGSKHNYITNFLISGTQAIGNRIVSISKPVSALIGGITTGLKSIEHAIISLCNQNVNRGVAWIQRNLRGDIDSTATVQRLIHKTFTLLFNLSIYPLSYAKSYIDAGFGSVLSNASGYVHRNIGRYVTGNIESESNIPRNSVNILISQVKPVSTRITSLLRNITGLIDGNTSIPRNIGRYITAIPEGNSTIPRDIAVTKSASGSLIGIIPRWMTHHISSQSSVTGGVYKKIGKWINSVVSIISSIPERIKRRRVHLCVEVWHESRSVLLSEQIMEVKTEVKRC